MARKDFGHWTGHWTGVLRAGSGVARVGSDTDSSHNRRTDIRSRSDEAALSCSVDRRTLAENLADLPDLKEGQEIIRPMSNPIKETGHLQVQKHSVVVGSSQVRRAQSLQSEFHTSGFVLQSCLR